MLTDERLEDIASNMVNLGMLERCVTRDLIDEIKRLRAVLEKHISNGERLIIENLNLKAELARYKTPNVDNIDVKP